MRTRIRSSEVFAVLILAMYGVACSDSGPSIGLTAEEAAAVGDQIEGAAAGGVAAGVGVGLAPAPGVQSASPPEERSFSFEHMRDCPGGGSITVTGSMEGSIDRETRTGTLSSQAVIVITDCVISRGEHTITVNTTPDITKTGEVTIADGEHSGTFTMIGSLAYEKDNGDMGTCEINVTMTISPDGRTRTGSICGRDVDKSRTTT